jgi:nucleotide-binding universal stress UspA family protein
MTVEASSINNNHDEISIRKILVPIDGSEYSLNAAKYAIKLAKDESAELFCIHATGSLPYTDYSPAIDRYLKDEEEKAQSWFGIVRNMARNEGIAELKTETFPYVTSVMGSIIDYAANKNIDLIVIGTKGRTGLKRFLMGSVANAVVQHAHCSVLLVRNLNTLS